MLESRAGISEHGKPRADGNEVHAVSPRNPTSHLEPNDSRETTRQIVKSKTKPGLKCRPPATRQSQQESPQNPTNNSSDQSKYPNTLTRQCNFLTDERSMIPSRLRSHPPSTSSLRLRQQCPLEPSISCPPNFTPHETRLYTANHAKSATGRASGFPPAVTASRSFDRVSSHTKVCKTGFRLPAANARIVR